MRQVRANDIWELDTEFYGILTIEKLLNKAPYTFYSEGVYSFFEELAAFIIDKNDIKKLKAAEVVEHKANSEQIYDYHNETKSIIEQLRRRTYDGLIIIYRSTNSWNDNTKKEIFYISKEDIDSLKKI